MFKLSQEGQAIVKKELVRYETKQSAIIPCLYLAQAENRGWVNNEVFENLSELMGIPSTQIEEVATFYTMFNKQPVGKYHIQICCNISCAMANARELTDHVCKTLGVREGDITKDGRFTVTRVECLGSCGTAPVAQIGDRYYENLSDNEMDQLLMELK